VFDVEPFWRGEVTWGKAPAVDIAEHEKAYEITVAPRFWTFLHSLYAREGWFDSVAFLISFSPGIPFPGSK
jgi:hypothetical protein